METWVRANIDAVDSKGTTVSPTRSSMPTILMGFSTATKECQHVYGPFWNDEEFVDFARLHSIDPAKVSTRPRPASMVLQGS